MTMNMFRFGRPAVLLDKDGTLVEDVPYNGDADHVRLAPGAAEAVRLFAEADIPLVVVTNQSGLARGRFTEDELVQTLARMAALVDNAGGHIEAIYCCPHHPDGTVKRFTASCGCRKPRPGLLHQAAIERGIDLDRSFMVGDILDDVAAGRAAGTRTVLLDNGHETEWELTPERMPDQIVGDLLQAARSIVSIVAEERRHEEAQSACGRRTTAESDRALDRIRAAAQGHRGAAPARSTRTADRFEVVPGGRWSL